VISRVPPRSSATESVFSTNTSNPEPLETRDALGRPLRLPLRPLGNQPGVVDDDVEAAQPFDRPRDQLLAELFVAKIARNR